MSVPHPPAITITPIKERTREYFADLLEQWKAPYPQGLGEESLGNLLQTLVTDPGKDLETMRYKDWMFLIHFIEERYRTVRRRKRLVEEGQQA